MLEGFLRQDNFIEAIYAFASGDVVTLNKEPPIVDKYKRKSFIILRIGKEELS